jgi:hypothetical protein
MLPRLGFQEKEWPSGVVSRNRPPATYREELAVWFDGTAADAPAWKALGTSDAKPARIPFLIF